MSLPLLNRRRFLHSLGSLIATGAAPAILAPAALTRTAYFFAPRGGWQPQPYSRADLTYSFDFSRRLSITVRQRVRFHGSSGFCTVEDEWTHFPDGSIVRTLDSKNFLTPRRLHLAPSS